MKSIILTPRPIFVLPLFRSTSNFQLRPIAMAKVFLLLIFFLTCKLSSAQLVLESSFGSAGTNPGQFTNVLDIAIAPDGNVYVSDLSNKIIVFDASGNFLFQFGSKGSLPGQFKYPKRLSIDNDGNIFVVDHDNNRIQKFDKLGNFITAFGPSALFITDIDVDRATGNIYFCTSNALHHYSNSGVLLHSFTHPGMINASAVGVINNKVYISAVQQQLIFDLNGSYISTVNLLDHQEVTDFIATPNKNFICSSHHGTTGSTLYDFGADNTLQGWINGVDGNPVLEMTPTAAFSPLNNKLYYLSRVYNQVRVYKTVQDINLRTGSNSLANGATYFFDNEMLMNSGATVSFDMENRSWGQPLALTGTPKILISGPQASSFILNTSVTTNLLPGETGSFSITFQPIQHGTNTAILTVLSDDPVDGSFTISLSGFGANSASEMPMDINTWLSGNAIAAQVKWQIKSDPFLYGPYDVDDSFMSPWSNWTAAQKNDLQKAFSHAFTWFYLDNSVKDAIPNIPDNLNSNLDFGLAKTDVSADDAWQIYVSWVAHNLFLEAYNIVPWSIAATDDESQKLLLNSSRMMFRQSNAFYSLINDQVGPYRKNTTGWTTISSPIYTYKFLADNDMIDSNSTRRSVIEKLLAWCNRSNMSHFINGPSYDNCYYFWQYRGGAPVQKIIEGTSPTGLSFSHWTAGCHGTGGFLRNVLRAVNIPVELSIMGGNLGGGHDIPIFRTENVFLTHGDNPYDAVFADSKLPTSSLLVPANFFYDYFGVDFSSDLNKVNSATTYMDFIPRPVTGYVGNDAGIVISGAQLTFTNIQTQFEYPQQTSYSVQTDAQGYYDFDIMPGTYDVTITRPGGTSIQTQIIHNNWPETFIFPSSPLPCLPPVEIYLGDPLTPTSAYILWDNPYNWNKYRLYCKKSGENHWSQFIDTGNEIVGLSPGTTYEAKVVRLCSGFEGDDSNIVSFTTLCPIPQGLVVTNITSSSALVFWEDAIATGNYSLDYRASGSINWTQIPVNAKLSETLSLTEGTTYEVRVARQCANSTSGYSNIVTFATACPTPQNLVISNISSSSALASWSDPVEVGNYTLEYRISGLGWTPISVANKLSQPLSLAAGTSYEVRVMRQCANGTSEYSNTISFSTLCPAPQNLVISNVTSSSALASWSDPGGVGNYTLEYRVTGGTAKWTPISVSTKLSHTLTLAAGTAYDVRVVRQCSDSSSGYSNIIISFSTPCPIPLNLVVNSGTNSTAVASWDDPTGVGNYSLEYRISGTAANWTSIPADAKLSQTFPVGLGISYDVRVIRLCTNSNSGYSNINSFSTICPTPQNLVASNITSTSALVSWSDPSQITGDYVVYYRVYGSTSWSTVLVQGKLSHSFTDLPHGTNYEVRVVRWCTNKISGSTGTIYVSTPCSTPTGLAADNISTSSATLIWTEPNSVTAGNYNLWYRIKGTSEWTKIFVAGQTSYQLSNLDSNLTYEATVAQICGEYSSAGSSTTVFKTHCSSRGQNSSGEYIDYVKLGSMTHQPSRDYTGDDGGYGSFLNLTAPVLNRAGTYTLSFSAYKQPLSLATEYWRAWIDFNQNGSFQDPGEQIMSTSSTATGTLTANFVVPAQAVLGNTMMRISMKRGATPLSCETFAYGEVEDYYVNIATSSGGTIARTRDTEEKMASQAEPSVEGEGITIYPNPVSDILTLSGAANGGDISITDIFGREVFRGPSQQQIDVSNLPAGAYLLVVIKDRVKQTFRFLKL